MTVGAHDHILYTWDVFTQIAEERFVLVRHCVTHGIRHVNGCCARFNSRFKNTAEVVPLAAGSILG